MRKAISFFLLLAMSVNLMACGSSSDNGSSTSSVSESSDSESGEETSDDETGDEIDEKVLRIGELWTIETQDAVNDGTLMKEKASVIETLVEVNDNFGLEPGLAISWENTDENTWVFQLRDDVTFHDGTKMDADAVVWSLENAFEVNPTHLTKTNITSVEATDTYEVTVTTSSPNAEIPEYMHTAGLGILAESTYDEDGNYDNTIGTGPFKVDSFDVSTGVLTVVRNEEYYGDAPELDKVIITGMSDSSTRALALESGEIDFTCDLPFNELDRLNELDNVYVEKYDTARIYSAFFNCGDSKFADKEVRQAISLAVDRATISEEVLYGCGTVAKNIFTENMAWNNEEIDCSTYDLDAAKNLMEEAGWTDSDGDGILDKDGESFAFTIYTYSERPGLPLIAEALQTMLGELGMDVQIVTQASGAFNNEVLSSGAEWGIYLAGMATCMLPSCYNFLANNYSTANTEKYGYSNAEFDRLLEECISEFDTEKRYEISKEIQELASEECNIMYICNYGVSYGFSTSVSNFRFNPTAHDYQWNTDITIS